jgi:hypothetical protein
MIQEQYRRAMDHLEAWWNHQDIGRALFDAVIPIGPAPEENLNRYWPSPQADPDIAGLVEAQLARAAAAEPLAEHLPILCHHYGQRGTPMNLAWYLGGPIRFTDYSVYVEHCIEDWDAFEIRFDPHHPWVKHSDDLIRAQGQAGADRALTWMPDLGDALTTFSLLRGTERLLMDLLEIPDVIEQKVRDFTVAFIEAHRHFHEIYLQYWPGDTNACNLWAPGTTYFNQCDFSTMISPAMFRQFVVPELIAYDDYLEYVFWHLDGYEEVRHVPALLELDFLRAIQIQPGANNPTASSEQWLPVCKQIQEAGKGLYVYAHSPEEFAFLAGELDTTGLLIRCSYPLADRADADRHFKLAEG